MANNFLISPQSGTFNDSKNVSLDINYLALDDITRIRIENVSNKVNVIFLDTKSEYFYLKKEQAKQNVKVNLNISPSSSQSIISLFVYVEREIDGEYKVFDIYSVIYYLKEESVSFPGGLNISPVFVGPQDSFGISISAEKNNKYIFSINDKRYIVLTNDTGKGSLSIQGNNFLEREEEEVVKRFPVYYYTDESNYTQKQFSGLHLHYLPASIKAAADEQATIDPRCSIVSETGWVVPEECLEPPEDTGTPCVTPNIPPGPPTKEEECGVDTIQQPSTCRISNTSSTLLYNGLTLHSFVSVDGDIKSTTEDGYNVPKVFISEDDTSLEVEVVAQRDVIVGPKQVQDNIDVYVDEDIWNLLDNFSDNDYRIIFNNAAFGYQSFSIVDKKIDEYRNLNILVVNIGGLGVEIDNFLFCVSAVIYRNSSISPGLSTSLPFVKNSLENNIPVVSASIGSNFDFVGNKEDSVVYVIAEAFIEERSQLFLYSFSIDVNFYILKSFGWKQLTFDGNNKNPKTIVDTVGNLHVFWESDRSGVYQVYYGVIGPSFISKGNSVLSSILDKHAELIQKEDKPYYYFDGALLVDALSDEYEIIPKYDTSALLDDNHWLLNSSSGANINTVISGNRLEDLNLTVNAFTDTALAFVVLEQDKITPNGEYDQYNYQIDFKMKMTLTQTDELLDEWTDQTLTSEEINSIFDTWKSKFTVEVDSDFSNTPVYRYLNNQFVLGRQDNIYDAIIPILGAYREDNPSSASNFEISFIENRDPEIVSNVRHFVLAIMLEKSVFKAVNAQYPFEYCSESGQTLTDCEGYLAEEKHVIYTGKAKLALLLKNDSIKASGDYDSEYTLVREFPQEFSIHNTHSFNVVVNYAKMYYEDAADYLDQFAHEEFSRFICSMKIRMDSEPIFSESFATDLSDKHRKFDIAFGVPDGGGYVADKMIPNKLSIYDSIETTFDFTSIFITSPTLEFDSQIVTVPSLICDQDDLFTYDNNNKDESSSVSFFTNFNLLSMAFNDDGNRFLNPSVLLGSDDLFLQVPLTFEGVNVSPSVSLGKCNDIHLVWQSNRDKYWNIYYSNSVKKGLPFRFETKITNTESNSIVPSVSVNQNGNRMVVWHDNRNGNFEIFSARSLEGYSCTKEKCKSDLFDNFGEDIETCSLTFDFSPSITGLHHFKIEFYSDNTLKKLFKYISTEDSTDGWSVNNSDFSDLCVIVDSVCSGIMLQLGSSVTVIYDVQNTDGIFDKILYYKLVSVLQE